MLLKHIILSSPSTDVRIKSPGTLVISTYVACPDIRVKITTDLKSPQMGKTGQLIWINIESKFRIGGSVLAQAYAQQGNDTPSLDKASVLKAAFNTTQSLLVENKLLAGHDISDGGLVVCLMEMAFAGLCGLKIDLTEVCSKLPKESLRSNDIDDAKLLLLFAEECGWVLEVSTENMGDVLNEFHKNGVPAYHIGQATGCGLKSPVHISCCGDKLISGSCLTFFRQWERTSFEIEKLQMNRDCAIEEFATYDYRTGPVYKCTFNPDMEITLNRITAPIRVAVIREEGTNGDREMIATLIAAKFEVHDVAMDDLLKQRTSLDQYRGVVFPGTH